MALALYSYTRFGTVTRFTAASLHPQLTIDNLQLWSTLAFAFCGIEASAFMAEEIENPRRTIPRALLISGITIAVCYFLGSVAMLVILPQNRIDGLAGPIAAIEQVAGVVNLPWLVSIAAVAMAVGMIASAGSFLTACARIPFAVGVDKRLPPAFARLHPKTGVPYVAVITQSVLAIALMFISQAGASVKVAYDVLISMMIVANFIPYLLLFAAMIRVQSFAVDKAVNRVPGGPKVAKLLAILGILATLCAIASALIPPKNDPQPIVSMLKVVGGTTAMFVVGWIIYFRPDSRAERPIIGSLP